MEELYLRTRKFLVYCGEIKGSETFLVLNLAKKIDSPREHYTSFLLVTRKFCYLLGKLKNLI